MLVYRSASRIEHTSDMVADVQRLADVSVGRSMTEDELTELLIEVGDLENAVLDATAREENDDLAWLLRMLTVCTSRALVNTIAGDRSGASASLAHARSALGALSHCIPEICVRRIVPEGFA